jgi:hypothetical protein
MRNALILLLSTLALAASSSLASADFTLVPITANLPSCAARQAWFAGACRDDRWVLANIGPVDAAAGVRLASEDAPLRILQGDTISWIAPVRVRNGAEWSTPRLEPKTTELDEASKGGRSAEDGSFEPSVASAFTAPAAAVAVNSIDPDAVQGGFLVQRRVTTSVESTGRDASATLVEERLDLMAPGGPRLVEIQRLEFDPTLAFASCEGDGPCVLAYAFSAGCVDEMIAAAEAEWVYVRTLVVGTLEEIVAARDAMVRAYAELHACLGIPY